MFAVNKIFERAMKVAYYPELLNQAFEHLHHQDIKKAVLMFAITIEKRLSKDYKPLHKDCEKEQYEHLKHIWLIGIENRVSLLESILLDSSLFDIDRYILNAILAQSYVFWGEDKRRIKIMTVDSEEDVQFDPNADEGYREFVKASECFEYLLGQENLDVFSADCTAWLTHIYGDMIGHNLSKYIADHYGDAYKRNRTHAISVLERAVEHNPRDLHSRRKIAVMLDRPGDSELSAHKLEQVILLCHEWYDALDPFAIDKFCHVVLHLNKGKNAEIELLDRALECCTMLRNGS